MVERRAPQSASIFTAPFHAVFGIEAHVNCCFVVYNRIWRKINDFELTIAFIAKYIAIYVVLCVYAIS